MVTQELLDYIKKELDRGANKEDIKNILLSNNWSAQDIDGAFTTILNEGVPQKQNIPSDIPKINSKAPVFVKIVASIMLLVGIIRLLVSGPAMLLGFGLKSFPVVFFGILSVLTGIGLIVTSFGLRKMRKWGLYVFTVITGLSLVSVIYSIVGSPGKEIWDELINLVIEAAILIYFWTFSKKFV